MRFAILKEWRNELNEKKCFDSFTKISLDKYVAQSMKWAHTTVSQGNEWSNYQTTRHYLQLYLKFQQDGRIGFQEVQIWKYFLNLKIFQCVLYWHVLTHFKMDCPIHTTPYMAIPEFIAWTINFLTFWLVDCISVSDQHAFIVFISALFISQQACCKLLLKQK